MFLFVIVFFLQCFFFFNVFFLKRVLCFFVDRILFCVFVFFCAGLGCFFRKGFVCLLAFSFEFFLFTLVFVFFLFTLVFVFFSLFFSNVFFFFEFFLSFLF